MKNRIVMAVCLLALVAHSACGQTQLIVNGGFESATPAPWQIVQSLGTGARIVSGPAAHGGQQYLTMGNASGVSQNAYQKITFPTNLIAATLRFNYSVSTLDPSPLEHTTLTVYITDTNNPNPNILATVGSASNLTPTSGYNLATYNLVTYTGQTNLSSYAGKAVEVYFFVTTDPVFGSLTTFNIDDVSMVVGTRADIPPNDNFTNRTLFTASSITIAATNLFASKEPGEPNHAGNLGGHSLWWTWTAPALGSVTINMTGSSFQPLLAVYTGTTLSNLTSVVADDGNHGQVNGTQVNFKVSPGTNYQIAVDGYNGASGNIALNFNFKLDTTPPKVAFSSPGAGANLTNPIVAVQGTASDNFAVTEVQYRLENVTGTNDYAVATGTNTWSATVTNLVPGPNTVRARAFDSSSNVSATATRVFNYVVLSPLTLTRMGSGTVSGATNGQLLKVGFTYKFIAKPVAGFGFAGWTGDITTNNATLSFVMRSNLVLQANFVDISRPVLALAVPKSNQRWSNEVFTATAGTAKDNVAVSNVFYQLNGGDWMNASTLNHWTNWTAASFLLTPGTNILSAYAVDTTGNVSLTNTIKFVYVLSGTLIVQTNGRGTISPNLNGALLAIGGKYSMTAKAAKGFKFFNWTGDAQTNNAKLSFTMASNLTFIANFVDATRPVNIITAPTVNQKWSNAVFIATGKASDNVGVSNVWYQIDGSDWNEATLAVNGTNWSTVAWRLPLGSNFIQAFAEDGAGNRSLTNAVKFTLLIQPSLDWAPDSLNGLMAQMLPGDVEAATLGFDPGNFSQMGESTNDVSGVGNYVYTKTGTNTAHLELTFNSPPTATNHNTEATLLFTNHYAAVFTNADSETGGLNFLIATNFVPSSLAGKSLIAVDGADGSTNTIKLINATSFAKTPSNSGGGSSSGDYSFARFSPVSGSLVLNFTNAPDLGQMTFVQLTFSNSLSGNYFITHLDAFGAVLDLQQGRFNLK